MVNVGDVILRKLITQIHAASESVFPCLILAIYNETWLLAVPRNEQIKHRNWEELWFQDNNARIFASKLIIQQFYPYHAISNFTSYSKLYEVY